MKILMAVERLKPTGGVEMTALQMSEELAKRGHVIDLLYEVDGELMSEYSRFCRSMTQVPRLRCGPKVLLRSIRRSVPVAWNARRVHKPDVVFVHNLMDVPWGIIVAAASGSALVCLLHEVDPYHRVTVRILRNQVDMFMAVSDFVRDQWIGLGLDPRRLGTVYCGIALERYPFGGMAERKAARTALGLPADAFIVLYLGRLDPLKRVDVLLEAWGRLTTDPARRRLVLLGSPVLHPDPDAYLRELKVAAPPSCVWIPMQSDVVQPLHAADVVVHPSQHEALGRVVLEGLATGRPVLASRVGGIPEILTDELSRFLVEPGDVAAFTRGMESLMNWRVAEPELARICSTRVANQFTLAQSVDRLAESLSRAVSSRRRRGLIGRVLRHTS
jgi:glycosyltransferase involved in cell wall biosynthesis